MLTVLLRENCHKPVISRLFLCQMTKHSPKRQSIIVLLYKTTSGCSSSIHVHKTFTLIFSNLIEQNIAITDNYLQGEDITYKRISFTVTLQILYFFILYCVVLYYITHVIIVFVYQTLPLHILIYVCTYKYTYA